MKAHPILFSTPMVQALLEGRKSQTRRIMKIQPKHPELNFGWANMGERWHYPPVAPMIDIKCPYGQPGDALWVKETWLKCSDGYVYRTNHYGDTVLVAKNGNTFDKSVKWKPSTYMPREAARIFLRVTDIRVERLQDITEEDVIAEGIDVFNNPCAAFGSHGKYYDYSQKHRTHTVADKLLNTAKESYKTLWESINGEGSWDANPWVWVIKFKRI